MASRGEEILLLAASGLTDKEIADQLGISVRTVDGHWRRLREQTGLSNKAGLIGHALNKAKNQVEQLLTKQIESLQKENHNLQDLLLNGTTTATTSAIIQTEINRLYKEVNDLRLQSQSHQALNSIVFKGNVLAFRIEAEAPHRCLFMSDSIRLLGYRASDFTTGRIPITELFHPEDFTQAWGELLSQIEVGTSRTEKKYRLISKLGEPRLVLDRSILEPATETNPQSIAIFAFDITHSEQLLFGSTPHLA